MLFLPIQSRSSPPGSYAPLHMVVLDWLRKRGAASSPEVAREVAALERAARATERDARGQLLNRCGDLWAEAGRKEEALRCYGQAVDSYLGAGFVAQAAAMCRKILRLSPAAVRPHCTLACLAAHENELEEARRRIDRYVDASVRAQTQRLAIARLRLVEGAMLDEGLRGHVARRLLELGDRTGAERIERSLQAPAAPERLRNAWERLLQAAAADPDDLWKFA